ncbi:ABC transporter substrate-binding protein [Pseudonocardia sp. ICBG1293]|uniref:ABC transporter substrate-binding protein n=1 Tax=Pseudonocardia sp. ICBG1293 TaxID=2844382 RepID=UPI001CCEC8EE|nr:ABC transporter substrate-binding protein [Pseudonocardia sp. ICBG1293]
MSRRSFLRATGTVAALAGVPALAACGAPADVATTRLVVAFPGSGPLGAPDPHRVERPVDRARAAAVADTLLVWDQEMRPAPHLAASVGPDRTGTRWRVRLRPAVAHDGRPITPADVLASLRRVADPDTGATAGPLLRTLDPAASRVVSPTELELVLGAPDFLFPLVLAAPGTGIVRDGRGELPVGTGAFRFLPGSQDALYRHDAHWLGAAPSPAVEFVVDDDEENRYQSLIDGYVAYAHDLFPHSARRIAGRTGTAVLTAPGSVTRFLEPRGGAFADPRLREAVRLGIDRRELVRTVLLDLGDPGDDLFGAGLAFHPAEVPPVVRDLDRARSLVADAGLDGSPVPLVFDPFDPLSHPAAPVVAEQLAAIGLRAEPREPGPPDTGPAPGIAFVKVAAHPVPLHLRAVADAAGVDDTDGPPGPGGARAGLAALVGAAAATPDERVRDDALRRALLLTRENGTVWSSGHETAGISADLTGVRAARPDTGDWARFHRARMG